MDRVREGRKCLIDYGSADTYGEQESLCYVAFGDTRQANLECTLGTWVQVRTE